MKKKLDNIDFTEREKVKKKIEKFSDELYLIEKSKKIDSIKFYEKFKLNIDEKYLKSVQNNKVILNDIYVVKENNNKMINYKIYYKNINNLLCVVNKGEIMQFNSVSMNKYIKNEKIDKIIKINDKNLSSEIEKDTNKNKKNVNKKSKNIESKNVNVKKVGKELGMNYNDIQACTEVKLDGDLNIFRDRVKESKNYDQVLLIYNRKNENFRFIGIKKGEKAKFLESIEPSKAINKKSININDNGENIKEENIKGLMHLKENNNYDFSVKIGQYGVIELNALRKDPKTNRYVSTKIETTTQKPTSMEVKKIMDKNKNTDLSSEIKKFDHQVKEGNKKIDLYEIADEDKKNDIREENSKIKEKHKEKENDIKENEKNSENDKGWGPWERMKPNFYE